MKTCQLVWDQEKGWEDTESALLKPQVVLYFGDHKLLEDYDIFLDLKLKFPNAQLVGCTAMAEIVKDNTLEKNVIATAIEFEKTRLSVRGISLNEGENPFEQGRKVGSDMINHELKCLLVLSSGERNSSSAFLEGIQNQTPDGIKVVNGIALDAGKAYVGCNCPPEDEFATVIGFYGEYFEIGFGSYAGWTCFGPERVITKSTVNVVHELDGRPALELYKEYIGRVSSVVSSNSMLFPLLLRGNEEEKGEIRRVLDVDHENNTITFAGEMPEGGRAKLMITDANRLISAACHAANEAVKGLSVSKSSQKLAITVSSSGRKNVLGGRASEEIKAVFSKFDNHTCHTGFYAGEEVSDQGDHTSKELNNQTMTIVVMMENDIQAV